MDKKKRTVLDFETEYPPVLTQTMLEEEVQRRKLNYQTALLALSGILLEMCFLLAAVLLFREAPLMGMLCIWYVTGSVVGGGVLVLLYHTERGRFLCQ